MRRVAIALVIVAACHRAVPEPETKPRLAIASPTPTILYRRNKPARPDEAWCTVGEDRLFTTGLGAATEVRLNGTVIPHPDVPHVWAVGPTRAFWTPHTPYEEQHPGGPGTVVHQLDLATNQPLPAIPVAMNPVGWSATADWLYLSFLWSCDPDVCARVEARSLHTSETRTLLPTATQAAAHFAVDRHELVWIGPRGGVYGVWSTRSGVTRRLSDMPLPDGSDCCELKLTEHEIFVAAHERLVRAPRAGGPFRVAHTFDEGVSIRQLHVNGGHATLAAGRAIHSLDLTTGKVNVLFESNSEITRFTGSPARMLYCDRNAIVLDQKM